MQSAELVMLSKAKAAQACSASGTTLPLEAAKASLRWTSCSRIQREGSSNDYQSHGAYDDTES